MNSRIILTFAILACDPCHSRAQSDVTIRTAFLEPDKAMSVAVSKDVVTTMTFPFKITNVTGYGLANEEGHPSTKFVCDPITPTNHINLRCVRIGTSAQMKVQLTNQQFYVFQLDWSLRPDSLINWQANAAEGTTNAKEITPTEIRQRRPRFLTYPLG